MTTNIIAIANQKGGVGKTTTCANLGVDTRTNFAKEISTLLRETYGGKIKVFDTDIPHSVRAAEISAEGKSIFAHDPKGKVAEAYRNLTKEVLKIEKQRQKHKADLVR